MHEKIEPVDGPDQLAFYQHLQFFPDVGGMKGSKAEGQAGDDQQPPWYGCEKFFHLTFFAYSEVLLEVYKETMDFHYAKKNGKSRNILTRGEKFAISLITVPEPAWLISRPAD